jgi:hypothetical protein
MDLRLIREPSIRGATFGVLFKDGHFFSFTLEDQVREVPGRRVDEWKVPGQTAIPAGRYRVTMTPSLRFGRPLPLLSAVPGFAGVRIHPLNTIEETEGCIGVGLARDDARRRLVQSRVACDHLQALIDVSLVEGRQVWLAIENPVG